MPQTINRHFASDNYAGVHPVIMQALQAANGGHVRAYGEDEYTERLQMLVRAQFGEQASAFPVFNGTGANVLGLQSLMPRWGSVICVEQAHIHHDESNAPQAMGGLKLWTCPSNDGKLTSQMIHSQAYGFGNEHRSQPAVVYISQASECGTCYTVDEIADLAQTAHQHGMKLYVDGARLANAAVSLDVDFRRMITETGVDMVSLGGTKNGLMFGECLISLNEQATQSLKYLRKMNMQTASKMRFISAQLIAMLENDFYREPAAHANQMAAVLADRLTQIDGIELCYPVQANAIFAKIPQQITRAMRQKYHFYDWGQDSVRLMCSFDTTLADIEDLLACARTA